MSTVLSIDLDYWQEWGQEPREFLSRVLALPVPIKLAKDHHQLLPFFNRYPADQLRNIDFHSDVTDYGTDSLNCGNWVNFVRWNTSSRYVWHPPSYEECFEGADGRCDSGDPETDPFKYPETCGWSATVVDQIDVLKLYLEDVIAVGICVSPDYLNWTLRVHHPTYEHPWRGDPSIRGLRELLPARWVWFYEKYKEGFPTISIKR